MLYLLAIFTGSMTRCFAVAAVGYGSLAASRGFLNLNSELVIS